MLPPHQQHRHDRMLTGTDQGSRPVKARQNKDAYTADSAPITGKLTDCHMCKQSVSLPDGLTHVPTLKLNPDAVPSVEMAPVC